MVRIVAAAEALMACRKETAASVSGAIVGREAMTAMIDRAQRHCKMRPASCSEGCGLGTRKGMASRLTKVLHLAPRSPEVSKSST